MALERVAALLGAGTRAARARLAEAALPLLGDAEALAGIEIEPLPDGVRLTVLRQPTQAQVWAAAVTGLVAAGQPSIDRMRGAVGAHGTVLAAGGWFHDPCVLAAKRRQFPGLTTTAVAEAGAAGAAYLAGAAAGLHPLPDGLDGLPWVRAASAGSGFDSLIHPASTPAREVL
jgi:sugar (pentulose or hexulose) kinase